LNHQSILRGLRGVDGRGRVYRGEGLRVGLRGFGLGCRGEGRCFSGRIIFDGVMIYDGSNYRYG